MAFDYQPEWEPGGGVAVLERGIASPATVAITLSNPPAEADEWQLRICNASKTETRFIGDLPVAGEAYFTDVPPDWDLPLCIDLTVYQYTNGQRQLYHIQSIWPDRDGYNPAVVIPGFGNFYFDFATERFKYGEAPPPTREYDGVIVLRQLMSGGQLVDFPTSMPLGVSAQVIVAGRNDNPTTERMRIEWALKDPTGFVEQRYGDSGNVSPDRTWGIANAPYFNLDKAGVWTIEINMGFIAPDGTAVLTDSYSGPLCNVAVEEEFRGSIAEKQLEFYEKLYSFLVNVPSGGVGQVIIYGQNNMATPQEIGAHWIVKDPNGRQVQEYYVAPAAWPEVPPGDYVRFTGAAILFDTIGPWTIEVELLMNPGTPITIDSYRGDLCTVTLEYAGSIIKKELEYDHITLAVGASVPLGASAMVHTEGRNDMSTSQILMFHWVVWDPDGLVALEDDDKTLFGVPPGGTEERMTPRFDLNKKGTYTLKAELLMNPDSPVIVDSYEGVLCTVTLEVPPEYELIQHTIYPYAYIYDGDVEVSTATFTTDPFMPSAWLAEKFASKLEEEVRARGGRPIEVKVYIDTTPPLWTNFRVEVRGTPLGGGVEAAGVAVGIALWLAIILVCLAITAVIVVATLAFTTIMDRIQHKPGLEDVKPGWGKETLILTIKDSEEYWERPVTPAETLERMSEPELRDYLDQIADEEVVPPAISWLPLVVVGGLGILGVGAAVALTAGKR
ncbi:hypothetical protein ES703_39301 [subsurface metagenome]